MKLKEFIQNFSEEYYVANLDDINGGCITTHIYWGHIPNTEW